jgi:hypothetical protein
MAEPFGELADVGERAGRSAGGHLERVRLAGEDVEAHLDAGGPGPLGERPAVVE